jgi:GR25 family glycosyltransferase involved in LPS biosynthesis
MKRSVKKKKYNWRFTRKKMKGGDITTAYLINLDERTDRWDQIQKDFKDTDIVLERISAVENKNGHYGIAKSIQKAVQIGKDNNLEYIIIFEDDNTPTENFNTNWPIIKEWLDNDTEWEIFNGSPRIDKKYEGEFYKSLNDNINLYKMKLVFALNFVCINKKAYDRILDYDSESILTRSIFDTAIDRFIGSENNFVNIVSYPVLGLQRSGKSNIQKKNINFKNDNIGQKEKFENFIKTLQTGGQPSLISYFTVSTKDTPELQRLKSSAEKFGWNIEVLGLEANTDQLGWEDKNNKSGDYGNFSIKLVKELEYVSSKSPDNIVLFTDAWDVICLGDSKTLYERFLTFNKDLVFGAEKECSPDKDKIDLYKNKNIAFPYLNSGFFIGKAGIIKKYLETYNGEKINDQKWWTDIYLENQDNIGLDTNALMCLQTWATDEKDYKIQDNKFTYVETNTNPIFIHANGYIKDKLSLFTPLIQNGGNKQKAYVINLKNRPEKYERIEKDFKDIFDLERFNAIKDTIGHKGCGESFKKLIRMAKENNMDHILILEDDCKPLDNFKQRWDIIKQWLDNNNDKWEIFNGGINIVQGSITNLIDKIDDNNTIKSIDKGVNCHMIYVKKEVYDKILEWDWHKNHLIDFDYINTSKFKTIFVEPKLCVQYDGYSNTEHMVKKHYLGGRSKTRKHKTKRQIGGKEEIIHYITVSTKDTPELQRLLESGKKFNWDITVLGLEMDTTEFRNMDIYNRNFQMKLYLVKDYLKNLNDNDIVLFSDAWDVVVIGTKETILEKYKKFKKPIVISAEKTCWPDKDRANQYDTLEEPFPYVNSGGYIGTVKALKTIFENYNNEDNIQKQIIKPIDDQRFWTNMYFKYRDLIGLDTIAEIFLSLFDTNISNYNFDNNIFTYKETNTNPIIIHGNGHHKDKLNNFNAILQNGGNDSNNKILFIGKTNDYKYFEDYIISIIYNLKEKKIDYVLDIKESFDKNYFNNLNNIDINKTIIIFIQQIHFDIVDESIIKKCFILNTEQLSRPTELEKISKLLNDGYKIIDYSLGNIDILKNKNKDNIFYIPYMVNDEEIIDNTKINEIATIGSDNENRKKYINFVNKLNMINLKIITGFNKERNDKLFLNKFLLNIHYNNEYKIYESMRCDRLIFNKTIIISEKCLEGSIPNEIKNYVLEFNNEDELINIIKDISKNIEEYYNNFWKDFSLENVKKKRLEYLDIFLDKNNVIESKEKAYVINIDKRPERWEQIQKDFKDTNLELERFSAIEHSNGHIGCGKSFQALIRMAKEKNMDHILIMEDDCHPIGKFNERLSEIYEWLINNKDKWEVFNGGIHKESKQRELKYEVSKKLHLYSIIGSAGAHFILFNKSSYDKVLEWGWDNPNQEDKHFDWYINNSKYFKLLYVEPPITFKRDGQSNTNLISREFSKNNSIQSRKKKRVNLNNTIGGGDIKEIYISARSENTRLGDALFCMIYFFNIKDYLETNNIQINFYIRSNFLNDIKEFTSKNINFLDIDKKPSENITDFWVGNSHEGLNLNELNPTKCWSIFLTHVLSYIGKTINLPPIKEFSYMDPTLLEIYNNLDNKYKNVDILIINGKPTSNQLNYKEDEWNIFCKKLSLLYNIVTTDKIDDIKCTRDDNLSAKKIAALSTNVKYIIGINTGPIVGCFNTYTLSNVKKWYVFDNATQYTIPNFIMNKPFNDILNDLKT